MTVWGCAVYSNHLRRDGKEPNAAGPTSGSPDYAGVSRVHLSGPGRITQGRIRGDCQTAPQAAIMLQTTGMLSEAIMQATQHPNANTMPNTKKVPEGVVSPGRPGGRRRQTLPFQGRVITLKRHGMAARHGRKPYMVGMDGDADQPSSNHLRVGDSQRPAGRGGPFYPLAFPAPREQEAQ